jgi:hypothetical protein
MKSFFAPCINPAEFAGFWVEPNTAHCRSEWTPTQDGRYHVGRILKANPTPGEVHRAYATWQPWKTEGACGPCMVSFDFKYSLPPRSASQWVSVRTLARKGGDGNWDPVGLNIDERGNLALMHLPLHDLDAYTRIGSQYVAPNTWHHIDILVDFRPAGSIMVLRNGAPCLYGQVDGGDGLLYQDHGGMYAEGSISSGWIANSNFRVQELPLIREIH